MGAKYGPNEPAVLAFFDFMKNNQRPCFNEYSAFVELSPEKDVATQMAIATIGEQLAGEARIQAWESIGGNAVGVIAMECAALATFEIIGADVMQANNQKFTFLPLFGFNAITGISKV
jgi:hypothetical protein